MDSRRGRRTLSTSLCIITWQFLSLSFDLDDLDDDNFIIMIDEEVNVHQIVHNCLMLSGFKVDFTHQQDIITQVVT